MNQRAQELQLVRLKERGHPQTPTPSTRLDASPRGVNPDTAPARRELIRCEN
jgi:hypothetical protein